MDSNTIASDQQQQPSQRPASTTAGVTVGGATVSQPRAGATKAQSEIGPTTYGGENGPVAHGADDAATKAAYAAGHPAQGIEHQRAQQPQQQAQQAQPATAQAQTTQQAPPPGQTRVRMTQDYLGHAAGTEITVDDATAKAWIDAGAAVQASSMTTQSATGHQG